jgi:hypothetical protein
VTRAEVAQQLRLMEHCRHLSYEAETKREERRLLREYGLMWRAIEPYVNGTKPYSDDAPKLI